MKPYRSPAHCSYLIAAALALLFSFTLHAQAGISEEVSSLVFNELNDPKASVSIEIEQSSLDPSCALAVPFLPHGVSPHSTRITVGFKCANGPDRFTQAALNIASEYPVLKIDLSRGTVITPEMLEYRRGPMHQLPRNALREEAEIVGKAASRDLRRGEPTQRSQLRAVWLVKRSERVEITAPGTGFSITRSGIALDNGSLGERIRIRLEDGKQITAKVTQRKRLEVSL